MQAFHLRALLVLASSLGPLHTFQPSHALTPLQQPWQTPAGLQGQPEVWRGWFERWCACWPPSPAPDAAAWPADSAWGLERRLPPSTRCRNSPGRLENGSSGRMFWSHDLLGKKTALGAVW